MTTKYALEVSTNNGMNWQLVAIFDTYFAATNAQSQFMFNYPPNSQFQVRYIYV